jgi:hypothetical protein
MRDLRKVLRQYIDLRRALGYKLRKHEPRLTEFVGFLEAQGTDRITTKLAVDWATQSSKDHKHSCCERLRIVRSFARHVSSIDARTEIPPTGTMRQPETVLRPYIYTQEEIGRLMAAARKLFSPRGLRCHTYHHLVGLLGYNRDAQRRSGSAWRRRRQPGRGIADDPGEQVRQVPCGAASSHDRKSSGRVQNPQGYIPEKTQGSYLLY